ncbi:cupin domain-containing protein [Thalassotalea agariperforans]
MKKINSFFKRLIPVLFVVNVSQANEIKEPVTKVKSIQTLSEKSEKSGERENLGKREVLLDNSKVLMVRLTYTPGSESGFHEHIYAYRTIYVVQGGQLLLINDNEQQTSKAITVHDGQALYMPASRHNIKNIGTTEIVLIETELK